MEDMDLSFLLSEVFDSSGLTTPGSSSSDKGLADIFSSVVASFFVLVEDSFVVSPCNMKFVHYCNVIKLPLYIPGKHCSLITLLYAYFCFVEWCHKLLSKRLWCQIYSFALNH